MIPATIITGAKHQALYTQVFETEQPDYSLLPDAIKDEIIRLVREEGVAYISGFEYSHGNQRLYITNKKQKDFGSPFILEHTDLVTFLRMWHAAEMYAQKTRDLGNAEFKKRVEETL